MIGMSGIREPLNLVLHRDRGRLIVEQHKIEADIPGELERALGRRGAMNLEVPPLHGRRSGGHSGGPIPDDEDALALQGQDCNPSSGRVSVGGNLDEGKVRALFAALAA
jgi:hypothetical protein